MARRIGGLVISRKIGESIQLDYPNGRREIILVESMVREGAKVIISEHRYGPQYGALNGGPSLDGMLGIENKLTGATVAPPTTWSNS